MSLHEGVKIERGYATVTEDEGVNYREIADTMTELGYEMNHSSARNHVLRVMRKFVKALIHDLDEDFDEKKIDAIAKDPGFQHGISDLLQVIEAHRRARMAYL